MEQTIDKKYKIKQVGVYNRSVYICPECNHSILGEGPYHIIGFCDTNIGLMMVTECPKCFTKYRSHVCLDQGLGFYDMFLEAIEEGRQLHFKKP